MKGQKRGGKIVWWKWPEKRLKKDGIDRENGINGGRYVFVRGQRRGSERELFRPSLSLVHAGLSEYCVPLASIVLLIYVC